MSFRSDFWVVVATAAPVIALACVVLFSDAISLLGDVPRPPSKSVMSGKVSYSFAVFAFWSNAANVLAQTSIFSFALFSLDNEKNNLPTIVAIVIEVFSVTLLMATVSSIALSKLFIRRFKEESAKPR